MCLHQFLLPSSSLTPNPLPSVYLLYLPFVLSSPVVEANLSPADALMSNGCGTFSTTPAANRKPDRLQGEHRECLSQKAGLLSIAMPMEAAAQSPALRSQIRSTAATPHSPHKGRDGPHRRRDRRLWQTLPLLALRVVPYNSCSICLNSPKDPSYLTRCWDAR